MRRMFSSIWLATQARILGVDAHDGGAEARERPVHDLLEDRALVVEVQVEGAARDAGGGHDVVDFCGVIPALREDIASVGEDLLSTLGLVHGRFGPV